MLADFKYLENKEFDEDSTYLFMNPLGWHFESKVKQDIDLIRQRIYNI